MPEPTDQAEPGRFAFANLTTVSDKLAVRSRTCEILAILADTFRETHTLVRAEDLRFFADHIEELSLAAGDDPDAERLTPYVREDLRGAFVSFAEGMEENNRPFMSGRIIGQMAVTLSESIALIRILDSLFGLGAIDDYQDAGLGAEPGNDAMRQRFPNKSATNLAEAAGVMSTDDPEEIISAIQKLLGS